MSILSAEASHLWAKVSGLSEKEQKDLLRRLVCHIAQTEHNIAICPGNGVALTLKAEGYNEMRDSLRTSIGE